MRSSQDALVLATVTRCYTRTGRPAIASPARGGGPLVTSGLLGPSGITPLVHCYVTEASRKGPTLTAGPSAARRPNLQALAGGGVFLHVMENQLKRAPCVETLATAVAKATCRGSTVISERP